jgi:hypothetical protein
MASETNEKNKWIDAVGKLITLTQERKLIWRVASTTYPTYEAENWGKILQLYSRRGDDDERISVLQLKDPESGVEWEFPSSEAIEHLMEAVRYQVVRVGDFLDQLLAEAV